MFNYLNELFNGPSDGSLIGEVGDWGVGIMSLFCDDVVLLFGVDCILILLIADVTSETQVLSSAIITLINCHVDLPLPAAVRISAVSVVVCRWCSEMCDLTESQRGMIVGAHLVGASATTVANVVAVSKGTVSNCHVDLPLPAAVRISAVSVVVCRWCSEMCDLTESQRGMIVGAHLVGASATTVANVVAVSKGTVSNVIRAYSMDGQTPSANQNSGQKTILSDRDRRVCDGVLHTKTRPVVGNKVKVDSSDQIACFHCF
ncbi:hypothetical protein C0J52_21018 [Blattella germanica]|nr:hypothetical protein C0J52_21018 [Blattella germanica]